MGRKNRRRDSILFTSSSPKMTVWKPGSEYSLCVDMDDYEPLTEICHVVHYEDFECRYFEKCFPNYPVREDHHSSLANSKVSCTFFGPKPCPHHHNWYGNVSFTVPINKFADTFEKKGLNWYYVETVDYNSNSCSRILLTTKRYTDLRQYYPGKEGGGGPWYTTCEGHYPLTNARRFDGNVSSRFGHVLEFMIEFPDHLMAELFRLCKIEVVDHSDAMDGYRKCRKYRTGRYWEECPSDWDKYYTRLQVNKFIKKFKNKNC